MYLDATDGYPRVGRKAFHKCDEELNAAIPVTEEQHPKHEVEYGL